MAYLTDGIKIARGTLNSAAINALNTTAQQLVAAPGAGLINIPIMSFFNAKMGSVVFNGGDLANVWAVYGTTANDQVNIAIPFITNQWASMSANTNYIFGCATGIGGDWLGSTIGNIVKVLSSNAINKPISLTCVNPITATTNGSCDYTIWYVTVPAA